MTTPQLLTIPETAEALRYKSTDTVYRLIAREHLPTVRIGGVTRVDAAQLQRWIDARKRAA